MDYMFNAKIEKLPRTKIRELQLKRLKKISETPRVTVLPPNTITNTGLKTKHVIDERIKE